MGGEAAVLLTAAACGAFGTAYVATSGGGPGERQVAAHKDDPLDRLVDALARIPPVRSALRSAAQARGQAECLRQMPVMLDVVTLGLSAGLSFDSSLELYCQRYHDVLARSLASAMLSWRLGTSGREEALMQVARELGVAALERFAGVVSQALAFGSPLASTLEQQAQAIRDEQRAQMEEEIERVPVKMLIPLGTLIVPAMLLAILGPLLGASLSLGQ